PGDLLSTPGGEWLPVERVADTGEWHTVYNFRVSEYHTYFIAPGDLAFDVWVHNSYSPSEVTAIARMKAKRPSAMAGSEAGFVDDLGFPVRHGNTTQQHLAKQLEVANSRIK